MSVVVDRHDECWNDSSWRTDAFLALVADHQLSIAQIADYTGRSPETVRHWRSGIYRPIPKTELRLLMLESLVGDLNAQI